MDRTQGSRRRFLEWLRASPAGPAGIDGGAESAEPGIAGLAADAIEYAEERVAGMETLAASVKDMACKRGCAHCCHLPVLTSVPEALLAARYAEEHLGAEACERIAQAALRSESLFSSVDAAKQHTIRAPCPFLVDDACSVYPARPLACRGWNSLSLAACERVRARPQEPGEVPQNVRYRLAYASVGAALAKRLEDGGLEGLCYLGPTLGHLLAGPTDGRIARWLAGIANPPDSDTGNGPQAVHSISPGYEPGTHKM